MFILRLLSLASIAPLTISSKYSTFLGKAFQAPQQLNIAAVKEVVAQAQAELNHALISGRANDVSLTRNATSASILVTSINSNKPLLDFSFNSTSTKASVIDQDTIFRIGSVSKVFTVYTLLVSGGFQHLEDLVVEHVPELRDIGTRGFDGVNGVDWSEITLGALAGQLAGIARDCEFATRATTATTVFADNIT